MWEDLKRDPTVENYHLVLQAEDSGFRLQEPGVVRHTQGFRTRMPLRLAGCASRDPIVMECFP